MVQSKESALPSQGAWVQSLAAWEDPACLTVQPKINKINILKFIDQFMANHDKAWERCIGKSLEGSRTVAG